MSTETKKQFQIDVSSNHMREVLSENQSDRLIILNQFYLKINIQSE